MSITFEFASQRAELWFAGVMQLAECGRRGNIGSATAMYGALSADLERCQPILVAAGDELAAVSDGPVPWPLDRGQVAIWPSRLPQCWSSAHEAAVGVAQFALEALFVEDRSQESRAAFEQLLLTRWDAMQVRHVDLVLLQERIRRERAKMLVKHSAPYREVSTQSVMAKRLVVNLACMAFELDGRKFDCRSQQAMRWIAALGRKPGQWVSSRELSDLDDELIDVRSDKLKKHLPNEIRELIETRPGAGSRINLSVVAMP